MAPAERRRRRRARRPRTASSSSWPGSRPGPGPPSWPGSRSSPRTCRCTTRWCPTGVDLPARAGRRRRRGGPHPPHRPGAGAGRRSTRGRSPTATAGALPDAEVVTVLTALATEARGRLRALVADVSGAETTTVGVRGLDAGGRRLAGAAAAPRRRRLRARGRAGSSPRTSPPSWRRCWRRCAPMTADAGGRAARQVRPAAPAGRRLRPVRRRAARAWPASAPRCCATRP